MLSCSTSMKTLVLPAGLDNNFRSGEISQPFLKASSIQVLEYKLISDSVIQSAYSDTTLTFGIILPRSSLVIKTAENKMVFGTDDLQCLIRYKTISFQTESAQNSLLTEMILKPDINDPNYDGYKKGTRPIKKMLAGVIKSPQLIDEALFQFEHQKAEKDFDSAHIKGYIKLGPDSLFIKPLYKEEMLRGKNVKPMQVLQGYCLMKGDALYAFLQHAPMIKTVYKPGLKDVLYLQKKTTPVDQMMVAAYFSLVSRLVLTTAEYPLY